MTGSAFQLRSVWRRNRSRLRWKPCQTLLPELWRNETSRGAIRLLENKKDRGPFSASDTLLLTYLYRLNGTVHKAEAFVAPNAALIKKDSFVDWL